MQMKCWIFAKPGRENTLVKSEIKTVQTWMFIQRCLIVESEGIRFLTPLQVEKNYEG